MLFKCETCGLSELCLPRGLTKSELENLDSISKARRRTEKGEALYNSLYKRTQFYAVSSGCYKVSTINNAGDEQITGFYLPGEIIGIDGLGGLAPHTTAVAIESSTACEIPEAWLRKLSETNRGLRQSFMRIISKEIIHEQQRTMMLAQASSEARLAGLIIDFSQRFEERGFSAKMFNLSMSRNDISNYLALAPGSLSRLLLKFKDKGYLKAERRSIEILDMDALYELSHSARIECDKLFSFNS